MGEKILECIARNVRESKPTHLVVVDSPSGSDPDYYISLNSEFGSALCKAVANSNHIVQRTNERWILRDYTIFDYPLIMTYEDAKTIDFTKTNSYPQIIVHTAFVSCLCGNHRDYLINRIIITENLISPTHEPTKIEVSYCTQCDVYLIEATSLEFYRDHKLYPLATFIEILPPYDPRRHKHDSVFDNMNKESKLAQCGYTMKKTEHLSDSERQRLLFRIIKNGLCTIDEVRTHLSWLLNRSGRWTPSCWKWEDDLAFINRSFSLN